VVSAKSENVLKETSVIKSAALNSCLVDGDAQQLASARRLRSRSLLISVISQIVVLAALILVPILSKTDRIALANVMPLPPYHPPAAPGRGPQRMHRPAPARGISFCLSCPPTLARTTITTNAPDPLGDPGPTDGDSTRVCGLGCSEFVGLTGASAPAVVPPVPVPKIVHVGHLDPAMLIHRIEPVYPTLAHQTRREGTVELHAIIATDGSVRSLQVLQGDAMFYQSALDAVGQWRYKPTFLNGNPVEVDTHITVIYKFVR
jgi:periplasmic protein TonB